MALQLGLVVFPNHANPTQRYALKRARALAADDPLATVGYASGVTPVPDPRLGRIADIIRWQEVVPAPLRFVDIG
jgi:ribosome-binding ATPase YchF (GTP1/OBG family)